MSLVVDTERDAVPSTGARRDEAHAGRSRTGRWLRRLAGVAVVLVLLGILVPRIATFVLARGDMAHEPRDLPRLAGDDRRAAIVLGAGLVGEEPSPLLRERIDAAIELLADDRVDLLVMSGDNTTEYHDEPSVMRRYAIDQGGVGAERVAVDYAGRRTWDSCVRAREVFGIEQAVVVTNAFHADRALVTCRAAGIDATGYSAPDGEHQVVDGIKWRLRELPASGRALLDAYVLQPEPAVAGDRIDAWDPCELYASLAPSVRAESAADFARFGCS